MDNFIFCEEVFEYILCNLSQFKSNPMLLSIVAFGLSKSPRHSIVSDFRPKIKATNDEMCVGYYACQGFEDLSLVAAQYGTTTSILADMNKHISGALSRGDILNVPVPCAGDKVDNDLYMDDKRYANAGLDYINKHGSAYLSFCRMDSACRGNFVTSLTRFKSATMLGNIDKNGKIVHPDRLAYSFWLEQLSKRPSRFTNRYFELRVYTLQSKDGTTFNYYTVYNGDVYDPGRNFINTYYKDAPYESLYFKSD